MKITRNEKTTIWKPQCQKGLRPESLQMLKALGEKSVGEQDGLCVSPCHPTDY